MDSRRRAPRRLRAHLPHRNFSRSVKCRRHRSNSRATTTAQARSCSVRQATCSISQASRVWSSAVCRSLCLPRAPSAQRSAPVVQPQKKAPPKSVSSSCLKPVDASSTKSLTCSDLKLAAGTRKPRSAVRWLAVPSAVLQVQCQAVWKSRVRPHVSRCRNPTHSSRSRQQVRRSSRNRRSRPKRKLKHSAPSRVRPHQLRAMISLRSVSRNPSRPKLRRLRKSPSRSLVARIVSRPPKSAGLSPSSVRR